MAENTENVKYEEEFIINGRGMKLFTCPWLPANQDPKGLVFLCHGYAMECSISMKVSPIADEMKPSPLVISILIQLCRVIPTWKLIPTQDVEDAAIKEPKRREEVRSNPYCYKGKPRLRTGYELLKVSLEIEKSLHEVSLPFLIVHGEADQVTDPSVSKFLVRAASSTDKTLKLYPDMCHALTSGEPPENMELVFSDIVNWLNKRVDEAIEYKKKNEREGLLVAAL